MKQYCVAREGWIFIAFFLVVTVVTYRLAAWWCVFPAAFMIFVTYFFRNPARQVPPECGAVLAPSDGVVMKVEEIYENRVIKDVVYRVSIFMSIFNVHINRTPLPGAVNYMERVSGRFLPAYKSEAMERNAKNFIGLSTDWGEVLVVQITGLVARRIVCWAQIGDVLEAGERFGLIRFGSCTEVYLPRDIKLEVRPGDKVRGGETILGRF